MTKANLLAWMKNFPQSSIQRLKSINNAANGAHHVILALSYGLYDERIRRLNSMVVQLLVSRLKAKRANRVNQVHRVNAVLSNFHWAVDEVTAVTRNYDAQAACNRVASTSLSTTPMPKYELTFNA